jgi:hypothetical protein
MFKKNQLKAILQKSNRINKQNQNWRVSLALFALYDWYLLLFGRVFSISACVSNSVSNSKQRDFILFLKCFYSKTTAPNILQDKEQNCSVKVSYCICCASYLSWKKFNNLSSVFETRLVRAFFYSVLCVYISLFRTDSMYFLGPYVKP